MVMVGCRRCTAWRRASTLYCYSSTTHAYGIILAIKGNGVLKEIGISGWGENEGSMKVLGLCSISSQVAKKV